MAAQGYRLLPYSKSTVRKVLWIFVGSVCWMTYRFPFQKKSTITYPDDVTNPEIKTDILEHEEVHVAKFNTWWGPWIIPLLVTLFPLPMFFSGRWFIERHAYLADIKAKRITVEEAVETLWLYYFMCWPRCLMRRWFKRKLNGTT